MHACTNPILRYIKLHALRGVRLLPLIGLQVCRVTCRSSRGAVCWNYDLQCILAEGKKTVLAIGITTMSTADM